MRHSQDQPSEHESYIEEKTYYRTIRHSALSKQSLRIEVLNENLESFMTATGFLFVPQSTRPLLPLEPEKIVLVTNYHVVTNHKIDGSWRSDKQQDWVKHLPRYLRVYLPEPHDTSPLGADPSQSNDHQKKLEYFEVNLYDSDPNKEQYEWPRAWYSKYHPDNSHQREFESDFKYKSRMSPKVYGPERGGDYPLQVKSDIALIPIPKKVISSLQLIDRAYIWEEGSLEARDAQNKLPIAQEVHVIGYPFSAKDFTVTMPIWTSGTIANEINSGPEDRFLIDARTRAGQSGSPVIVYRPEINVGGILPYRVLEKGLLVGIYSGRTSTEDDLGFVWLMNELVTIYWPLTFNALNAWERDFVSIGGASGKTS